MRAFLSNRWSKTGVAFVVIGWQPHKRPMVSRPRLTRGPAHPAPEPPGVVRPRRLGFKVRAMRPGCALHS